MLIIDAFGFSTFAAQRKILAVWNKFPSCPKSGTAPFSQQQSAAWAEHVNKNSNHTRDRDSKRSDR